MSASAQCYNIVVFGEPSVGKTCFIDQFCYGRSFVIYDPDNSVVSHEIVTADRASNLTLMDLSTSFLKPEQSMHSTEWAEKMLAEADGVVLLYDVTNLESFEYVTNQAYKFLWRCRRLRSGSVEKKAGGGERESFGCVLVGNKFDLVSTGKESRAVSQSLANEWAQTQGSRHIEVDSLAKAGPESALKLLVQNAWKFERLGLMEAKDKEKQEEEASRGGKKGSVRSTLREVFKSSKT